MRTKGLNNSIIIITIIAVILAIAAVEASALTSANDAAGYVNSSNGLNMREHASKKSKAIKVLKDNTKVTIIREVYTSKTKTSSSKKWYYVSVAGKKGYVMAKYVDNVSYASVNGKTTSKINVRKGPGTKMATIGTVKKGKTLTVVADSKVKGVSKKWYKVKIGDSYSYVSAKYIKLSEPKAAAKTTTKATTTKSTSSKTSSSSSSKTSSSSSNKTSSSSSSKPASSSTTSKPADTGVVGPDSSTPPDTTVPAPAEPEEPVVDPNQQKRAQAFLSDLKTLGKELISKGFKYKCGGASNNYATALSKGNKVCDCAVYVSWSMQRCGYLSTSKKMWLNDKVNGTGASEIKSNSKLLVMYPNKTFKSLDLLPGDIIGYKTSGGQHTMVYAGKTSAGKTQFYSAGGSDFKNKNLGPVTKNIDSKKIGVVIRIK